MPHYFFDLRDGKDGIKDLEGVELADDRAARHEAEKIAHQLMQHAERSTRHWRLDVSDAERKSLFGLPFASVDETLAHLHPATRLLIERAAETWRGLLEAQFRSRILILQSRAIIARSQNKPYIAASRGQRI